MTPADDIPAGLVCSVRYSAASTSTIDAPQAWQLCARVAELGAVWGGAVRSYLGRDPDRPVAITVSPGGGLPRTWRNQIVLPIHDDAGDGISALSHELVHAVAGRSPSHLLNEGLAVHVDATIGLSGPVWPFFHLAPRRWARLFLDQGRAMALADLIAAPRLDLAGPDLAAGIREFRSTVTTFHLLAASYAGYLFEHLSRPVFWESFHSGRALPAGADLPGLERAWKASLGGPLTAEERALERRSEAELERVPLPAQVLRQATGVSP